MKTSNFKIGNMKYGFSILSFAIVSLFFMAGCDKSEQLVEPSFRSNSNDNAADVRQINPITRPFKMIEIDHQAMRSRLPDYSVSVNSDGTVLFEGRRNVATVGKRSFSIAAGTLEELMFVFKSGGFMSMHEDLDINSEIPRVATSFAATKTAKTKTLVDANNYPAALIRMRTKVELILHVENLVKGDDWPQPPAHDNF